MRERYRMKLAELNEQLIEMGSFVENAIDLTIESLINNDHDLANRVIEDDHLVNAMEREIESFCLKLILREQPIACDLRLISSVQKIITDLERMGDQAQDISEIVVSLENTSYLQHLGEIPRMARATIKMVSMCIDAFVNKDVGLAKEVFVADDEIDHLFVAIRTYLVNLIHEDPRNGEQAIDLIMIAKYLERIGDHAVNIAGWVMFTLTGKHKGKRVI